MTRRITLTQAYHLDIDGLSAKEREPVRSLWHMAAKRYLNMMSITSDPVPPVRETIWLDENEQPYGVLTVPVDYVGGKAFLIRDPSELEELYRETQPKARGRRVKVKS